MNNTKDLTSEKQKLKINSLHEYMENNPIDMLRGATVLLEGLTKSNNDGMHRYTNEASTILEFLITDCTAVISNNQKKEL